MPLQRPGVDMHTGRASSVEAAGHSFGEAVRLQHQGKFNEAIRLYKQVLALTPNHAEVWNNLGCVYLAQGKLKKARAGFERALVLMPELFDDFAGVRAMLVAVNPAIGEGMQSLEQHGWSEGRNIRVDIRFAGIRADQYQALAKEVVALKPDAILGHTTPVVVALQRESSTVPIVFVNVSDPIGSGFVASLARPAGN